MENRMNFIQCCNPFNKPNHSHVRKSLRNIMPWMLQIFPHLTEKRKICASCRLKLSKLVKKNNSAEVTQKYSQTTLVQSECEPSTSYNCESSINDVDSDHIPTSSDSDDVFIETNEIINCLNICFKYFGQEELRKSRFKETSYIRKKLRDLVETVAEKIFKISFEEPSNSINNENSELIKKIKEKYVRTNDKDTKFILLTLLPEEWSISKIVEEFPDATSYMARKSKQVVKESGILSISPRKQGYLGIDSQTQQIVMNFYNNDNYSRVMPGKKDYVSVKVYMF